MAPPKAPKLPLCRLVSDTCKISEIRLFRNPSVAPGMGLGDDLVTIRVLEHPGGPTLWPLGLCSPCHGPPKSFKIAVCRWFNGTWCEHKPLKQFSTLYKPKMENFAKHFFDIVTTYNDEICYVKHVLAPYYVFFTLFGCGGGGGAPKGSRAQPAYAVFPPQQLKNGNHLAEVVRSKLGRRIYGENATYPPILAILGLFAYPTPRG